MIKSIAGLRRAIVPGTRIEVIKHWQPHLIGTSRVPVRIQKNGYSYVGPNREGRNQTMWCHLPPTRAQIAFNEDGTVTYYPGEERSWTVAIHPPLNGGAP